MTLPEFFQRHDLLAYLPACERHRLTLDDLRELEDDDYIDLLGISRFADRRRLKSTQAHPDLGREMLAALDAFLPRAAIPRAEFARTASVTGESGSVRPPARVPGGSVVGRSRACRVGRTPALDHGPARARERSPPRCSV